MGEQSKKQLEPLKNKAILTLETECVRLGTVKSLRSIPTSASINDLRRKWVAKNSIYRWMKTDPRLVLAMKYSSGTSTGAVNMEIKLPAINAIASP
jgi:hypothetical protein